MNVQGLNDKQISEKVKQLYDIFKKCVADLEDCDGEVTHQDIQEIVDFHTKQGDDNKDKDNYDAKEPE